MKQLFKLQGSAVLISLLAASGMVQANSTITAEQLAELLKKNPTVLNEALKNVLNQPVGQETLKTALTPHTNKFLEQQNSFIENATKAQNEKFEQLESQFGNLFGDNKKSMLVASTIMPLINRKYDPNSKEQIVSPVEKAITYADRHVYFTTTAGYQWATPSSKEKQKDEFNFSQQDNLTTNFALGIYINPNKVSAAKETTLEEAVISAKGTFDSARTEWDRFKDSDVNSEAAKTAKAKFDKAQAQLDKAQGKLDNILYRRGFAIQGEYNEVRAKTSSDLDVLQGQNSAQKSVSLVGLVPILPRDISNNFFEEYDTHIYGIVGAGYTTLKASTNSEVEAVEDKDIRNKTFEDGLGIIGVGYSKGISKDPSSPQIIGEVRAVYNIKENYWQPQAMAGIRVGLGQYASKYLP